MTKAYIAIALALVAITIASANIIYTYTSHHKTNYPKPPANITLAMKNGLDCWLELSYNVHGNITKKEWLCK